MEAARERRRLLAEEAEQHLDLHLSGMSRLTSIDFSKFDLDEPLPPTSPPTATSRSLAKWIGKTPRDRCRQQPARRHRLRRHARPRGRQMQEIMEEVGGDGFLIFNTYFDRRYVMEVCDGLVPELQRRGLTRKAYAHKHLRDNLLELPRRHPIDASCGANRKDRATGVARPSATRSSRRHP